MTSKITLFSNVKDTSPLRDLDFSEIMDAIASGIYKEEIEKLRNTRNDLSRDRLKKALPAFTGSGTFTKRRASDLVKHSGKIIIDIDKLRDVEKAKGIICKDPFVEYCFKSCSGKGLAVVFKIDPKNHNESFEAIKQHLESRYKLEVDKGVKDVARLRFISYDPDLYYNEGAKTFKVFDKSSDVYDESRIIHIISSNLSKAQDGERHIVRRNCANLAGGFIASGLVDEETIRSIMQNEVTGRGVKDHEKKAAFKTIEDGINNGKKRPISAEAAQKQIENVEVNSKHLKTIYWKAHNINRNGRMWTDSDVDNLFKLCAESVKKKKIRSIFKNVFKEFEDDYGINKKPAIFQAISFLDKNYEFRKNDILQRVEYRRKDGGSFKSVNYDEVAIQLEKAFVKFPLAKVRSLLGSEYVKTYNPLEEYFNSLEPFDLNSKKDPIADLANHIKAKHQDFFVEQFRKALVRQIACALTKYVNRIVIVLVSEKQSNGKSTFLRFLTPFEGGEYYTESPITSSKDTSFQMVENMVYNIEELSSLSRTDVNGLKAIISQETIRERKPYAVDAEVLPRRCTFWGSTNQANFLVDVENTRWICIDVDSISWEYTEKIDISEVYSQAFALYKDKNFNMELSTVEVEKRDLLNKGFEVEDPEKILINYLFDPASKSEGEFIPNKEILDLMNEASNGKINVDVRRVGRAFKSLGFVNGSIKRSGKSLRGYYVRKVGFHEIEEMKANRTETDDSEGLDAMVERWKARQKYNEDVPF